MKGFTKRLRAAQKAARMTISDLRLWFDRPYATVRTWVVGARTPQGPAGEEAFLRLAALERKIEHGFLVPVTLSVRERPQFMKRHCHARQHRAGFSFSHPAE